MERKSKGRKSKGRGALERCFKKLKYIININYKASNILSLCYLSSLFLMVVSILFQFYVTTLRVIMCVCVVFLKLCKCLFGNL